MMKKTEQEVANELDAFLSAHLQQRPLPPVDDAAQTEAQLAADLLELAKTMEPDPVFLSRTEAEVAQVTARRKKRSNRPEQSSFWQQLISNVKETFTMRRTAFALGTLATILVVGMFAFFWMRGGVDTEPETVAVVPETAETTDAPGDETSSVDEPGTSETVDEADAPASPTTPDPENLPSLPAIGQAGGGRGFGGGGGGAVAAESSVPVDRPPAPEGELPVDEPFIWNPLAEAVYNVTVPFPAEPTVATVYRQPGTPAFTPEEVLAYAQLFGMNGPVYTEVYPEPVFHDAPVEEGYPAPVEDAPEGGAATSGLVVERWTPPTFYFVFDGKRQLSFFETNIHYFDQTVAQDFRTTTMPFAEAAPIAEAYLQELGLLDFEYVTTSPYGADVEIRRIIDGHTNTTPEFYVTVTDEGEIMSISYQPFDKLTAVGDYPLRPAADAWQQFLDEGIDYRSSYWITYPGPDFEMPEPMVDPAPFDEQYRYWNRTFADGDPITLISYPLVYLPVTDETAAPRIMVDQYLLSGETAALQALAEYAGQPVRINGIVRGTQPDQSIELSSWEPVPNQEWQFMPGTIRLEGEQTLFAADGGETFVIPSAPADLSDGERVNLSGWSIEQGDPYRIFNWSHMDRIVEWEEPPAGLAEPMPVPVEPIGEPYQITDITITEIDLVYQFSPVFAEEGGIDSFFLQPAWRFRGTTNTDEIIEIFVQAAAGEFVE